MLALLTKNDLFEDVAKLFLQYELRLAVLPLSCSRIQKLVHLLESKLGFLIMLDVSAWRSHGHVSELRVVLRVSALRQGLYLDVSGSEVD